jgi:hypothetical protein
MSGGYLHVMQVHVLNCFVNAQLDNAACSVDALSLTAPDLCPWAIEFPKNAL